MVTVTNQSELDSAISSASGGEIIELSPGTYANASVINKAYSSEVIIKALDPANKPIVGSTTRVTNSQNVSYEDIYFDLPSPQTGLPKLFLVDNGQNVRATRCVFDGANLAAGGGAASGFGAGYGIHCLNGASGVTFEDCEIFTFAIGVFFQSVDGAVLARCDLHDMKTDGVHVSGLNNAIIEDSVFHDFRRAPDGTHSDMIQFTTWNHTSPTTDIEIRRNFFNRGAGSLTESLFMRNGAVETQGQGSGMYYRRINIRDNLIYNSHHHGITLGESAECDVSNNTILQSLHDGVDPGLNPGLGINSPDGTNTWSGNVVGKASSAAALECQRSDPAAPNYYNDLFVNALADGAVTLADLQVIPGSAADGLGSILTRQNGGQPMPDTITVTSIDAIRSTPAAPLASAVIEADNTITIDANDVDYTGTVEVDYTVTDAEVPPQTASATIFASFTGSAPTAADDIISGPKGSPINLDPKLNDTAD